MTYAVSLVGDAPREGATPVPAFGVAVNDSCNELHRLADDWVSVTPTVTSGLTVGNATRTGFYRRTRGMIQFYGSIVFGTTTTSVSSPIVIASAVPTSGTSVTALTYGIDACLYDASAGYYYSLQASWNRLSGITVRQIGASTALANTVPWVWATGDAILWAGQVRTGNPTTKVLW